MKVNCLICNKEINRHPSQIKRSKCGKIYCSRSCANSENNKLRKGNKNPNFKTGISIYRKTKLEVEDNKCFDCSNGDYRVLEVHHIDGNRKNNNLDNLVILCANCHLIRHFE